MYSYVTLGDSPWLAQAGPGPEDDVTVYVESVPGRDDQQWRMTMFTWVRELAWLTTILATNDDCMVCEVTLTYFWSGDQHIRGDFTGKQNPTNHLHKAAKSCQTGQTSFQWQQSRESLAPGHSELSSYCNDSCKIPNLSLTGLQKVKILEILDLWQINPGYLKNND